MVQNKKFTANEIMVIMIHILIGVPTIFLQYKLFILYYSR